MLGTGRWLLLVSFLCVSANAELIKPGKPQTWICYTTAGSASAFGGKSNVSSNVCDGGHDNSYQWVGYIGAVVAILGFGSNFLPVKRYDTGDGVFFQWILCVGIWLVGLVVNLIRYQPPFHMPALMGGFMWTTGNLLVVPIIKLIGMTMGLTVWGSTNLLAGWLSGRVILKQHLSCYGLNYGGVACVFISTFILAFVKSEGKVTQQDGLPSENAPLIQSTKSTTPSLSGSLASKILQSIRPEKNLNFNPPLSPTQEDNDYSWTDNLGPWPKRIIGFSLSLCIGFLFGFQFIFVEFMRLCDDHSHSCNELDYVFGQFTGILVASTMYLALYCAWTRNYPKVYPKVILPGLASGILWAIAMVGWFLANQHLSLAVSFPIVTSGPGFVSSFYGIIIFREIKGWKNIVLFFSALTVSVIGLVMVALSNETVNC